MNERGSTEYSSAVEHLDKNLYRNDMSYFYTYEINKDATFLAEQLAAAPFRIGNLALQYATTRSTVSTENLLVHDHLTQDELAILPDPNNRLKVTAYNSNTRYSLNTRDTGLSDYPKYRFATRIKHFGAGIVAAAASFGPATAIALEAAGESQKGLIPAGIIGLIGSRKAYTGINKKRNDKIANRYKNILEKVNSEQSVEVPDQLIVISGRNSIELTPCITDLVQDIKHKDDNLVAEAEHVYFSHLPNAAKPVRYDVANQKLEISVVPADELTAMLQSSEDPDHVWRSGLRDFFIGYTECYKKYQQSKDVLVQNTQILNLTGIRNTEYEEAKAEYDANTSELIVQTLQLYLRKVDLQIAQEEATRITEMEDMIAESADPADCNHPYEMQLQEFHTLAVRAMMALPLEAPETVEIVSELVSYLSQVRKLMGSPARCEVFYEGMRLKFKEQLDLPEWSEVATRFTSK